MSYARSYLLDLFPAWSEIAEQHVRSSFIFKGKKNHRIHVRSHRLGSAHMVFIAPLILPQLYSCNHVSQSCHKRPFLLKLTACPPSLSSGWQLIFRVGLMKHQRVTPWHMKTSPWHIVSYGSNLRKGNFSWIGSLSYQRLRQSSHSGQNADASRQGKPDLLAVENSWSKFQTRVFACVSLLESGLWWISSSYIAHRRRIKRDSSLQFSAFDNQATRILCDEQRLSSGVIMFRTVREQPTLWRTFSWIFL